MYVAGLLEKLASLKKLSFFFVDIKPSRNILIHKKFLL